MASRARRPKLNGHVFINCPFDDAYRPCFEALVFTIVISGYEVRCVLEESDAGDIRFDKLCRLISESDHSIYDLSRTQVGQHGLPRFNMPFELGLMMGAKRFGTGRQALKRAQIMVAENYVMPRYLSDLAGNDPAAHHNDPRNVARIARDALRNYPTGKRLPGATHIVDLLDEFRSDLPQLASEAHLTVEEVHPFSGYKDFIDMVRAFRGIVYDIAD